MNIRHESLLSMAVCEYIICDAVATPRSLSFEGVFTSDDLTTRQPLLFFLRKEVIQPHLPIRLPCYDFTPVTKPAFGSSL